MRYYGPILVLVIIAMLASGCVVSEKIVWQSGESSRQLEIVYPPRQMLDPQQTALDLELVMAAIIEKMRGDRYPVEGVMFSPGGVHEVTEAVFKYEGFDLKLADILGYETFNLGGRKIRVRAAGLLHFEDRIARRASAYFSADYVVSPDRIVIEASAVALVPTVYPRLQAYFMPQSVFDDVEENDLGAFTDFYLYTVLNAVPMVATAEEKKEREAYEKLSLWKKIAAGAKNRGDYYIIVFCMDRLADSSDLRIKISTMPGMSGPDLAEPVYRYDNGWRTMISGGNFDPDSTSTHFYASVQYTADPEAQSEPLLIGCFKNEKNYSPQPALEPGPPPATKATASGSSPAPAGPLAAGERFLDPSRKGDGVLIQTRLKEQGYYKGAVDGLFGKGSRRALATFAAAAGLNNGGQWSLETQKALFRGSGR